LFIHTVLRKDELMKTLTDFSDSFFKNEMILNY